MAQEQEKWIEYAALIQAAIMDMLQNDENSNHIDIKDLQKDENLKAFFHALANVVPGTLFNKWTRDNKNFLEFNHLANQLCFEYTIVKDSKEKPSKQS